MLSGLRDAAAATRLFRKALTVPSHPQPSVINTDQARLSWAAISRVNKEGILRHRCRHQPIQYVNNMLEPDHRAIKRRVTAKQGFRSRGAANDPGMRGHAHDPEGAGEALERFGWSATNSVHQQAVRSGCTTRRAVHGGVTGGADRRSRLLSTPRSPPGPAPESVLAARLWPRERRRSHRRSGAAALPRSPRGGGPHAAPRPVPLSACNSGVTRHGIGLMVLAGRRPHPAGQPSPAHIPTPHV